MITCHNVLNGGPRPLLFFQCGAEVPQGWTALTAFTADAQGKKVRCNQVKGEIKQEYFAFHY